MKANIFVLFLTLTLSLQAGIGEGQSGEGPLPVELTSFSVSFNKDKVLLNWTTATEVNNYGFEIETSTNPAITWEVIGFVNGHGNSNSPNDYSFVYSNPLSSDIYFRLKQIDKDGKFSYSSVIELKNNLVKEFILEQNYPNPFNPETIMSYSIPVKSYISIKIFNVLGKTIATLVNQNQEAGSYNVTFNAAELSNGIYFYKINAGQFTSIKKMLLIK